MTSRSMRYRPRPAKTELTAERVREILDYDPETGIFRWRYRIDVRKEWNTVFAGTIAGSIQSMGYWQISIDEWPRLAHRLAWLYVHGEWPEFEIDHANTIKTDNRLINLRSADHSENGCNRPMQSNNTAGWKGVSFHEPMNRWRARISKAGHETVLGYFDTPEEAASAYAEAVSLYHGRFART